MSRSLDGSPGVPPPFRIVDAATARGISVRGGWGEGSPTLTTELVVLRHEQAGGHEFPSGVIWLNGDQALEEDCETCGIWPEMNGRDENWFTKTAGCPYDVVVGAILLRLKALAPEAVRIGADAWTDEGDSWTQAEERPPRERPNLLVA